MNPKLAWLIAISVLPNLVEAGKEEKPPRITVKDLYDPDAAPPKSVPAKTPPPSKPFEDSGAAPPKTIPATSIKVEPTGPLLVRPVGELAVVPKGSAEIKVVGTPTIGLAGNATLHVISEPPPSPARSASVPDGGGVMAITQLKDFADTLQKTVMSGAEPYKTYALYTTALFTLLGLLGLLVGFFMRKSLHELEKEWRDKLERKETEWKELEKTMREAREKAQNAEVEARVNAGVVKGKVADLEKLMEDLKRELANSQMLSGKVDRLSERLDAVIDSPMRQTTGNGNEPTETASGAPQAPKSPSEATPAEMTKTSDLIKSLQAQEPEKKP